jgi:hypothetical protein
LKKKPYKKQLDTFNALMQVVHCDASSGLEIDPVPLVKLVVALYLPLFPSLWFLVLWFLFHPWWGLSAFEADQMMQTKGLVF